MLLKKIVNRLNRYITRPGELFRYSTPNVRSIYSSLCKSLFFFSFRKRKNYFNNQKTVKQFNEKTGYFSTQSFSDKIIMKNAVNSAEIMFDKYLDNLKETDQKKSYLHTVPFDKGFDLNHPIMKLALSDEMVDIATSYLKFLPILSEIRLWYSPNTSAQNVGSQLFHLDYADISQVKVFIPIEHIDEDCGPLTFIPANISKKICKNINYKLTNDEIRVEDAIVNNFLDKKDYCKATGNPGDMFFVDTSRCLHYGSRGATKSRKILMIQYISPFSFSFPLFYKNKTTFSHLANFDSSKKTKLLLGSI